MNDFTKAWLVVACITAIMMIAQLAISTENPNGIQIISDNNMVTRYQAQGQLNDSNPYSVLPSATTTGQSGASDYTDQYRVSQDWMGKGGGNFLQDALSAPYNILKSMNLPGELVWILGSLWYGLLMLLTAMMLLGKGN